VISATLFAYEINKISVVKNKTAIDNLYSLVNSPTPTALNSNYFYGFDADNILQEAGSMSESLNSSWWLNSGGLFYVQNKIGKTIQAELPESDNWRLLYNKTTPRDTDNGHHPQNIFRLVTKSKWKNFSQQTYYLILKDNLSNSYYRNASNGLLLFNRYQDGKNLYYAGIRVDGFAVIKKKIKGVYYTMAYKQIFEGEYDRVNNQNLLPKNKWLGLKSEVINGKDETVNIKLFIDKEKTGNWELIAEAEDDGKSYGGGAILSEGCGGIRTDFMDVEFDNYKIEEMKSAD
jgi:hypothetical protein